MPTQLQFRRGTTAQTASFTGGVAEVTVDTDKNVIVVHDGVTSGGWPAPQLTFVQSSFNKANTANSTAQAAFDYANTIVSDTQIDPYARATANAGFNKANTANTLAQAGFDAANTKYSSSGGTISGNINVTGNVSPTTDNVYSLGSQSYRWKDLYVGPGSVYIDNIVLSNTGGTLTITGASDLAIAGSSNPSIGNISGSANAAFDKANTANSTAQAGFDKANTANSTAQAGFDVANTKYSSSGGTLSGTMTITGDLNVQGNTTFVGNVTTTEVSTLNIADPLIFLAANNQVSDSVDIGFIGHYFDGVNLQHTGLFRDPNLDEYIFMGAYQSEVSGNNLIDISNTTFAYANVNASVFKGNIIANTAIVNGFNVTNYISSAYNQANTGSDTAQSAFNQANTDVTNITISSGTFGNNTTIPSVTVAANGRVTAISATSFTAGASIADETSSANTFYPLFANQTSGTPTSIFVSSTKLSYVPSTGTITAVDLNTTSDVKYKENVEPVSSALNIVGDIQGVSFNWKETGSKSYGIIAQELQKILPELVHNTERGLSVSYLPLIAILIEAVKEQQKQIDELKKQ